MKNKKHLKSAISNAKIAVMLFERILKDKENSIEAHHTAWIAEGDLLDALRDVRDFLKSNPKSTNAKT